MIIHAATTWEYQCGKCEITRMAAWRNNMACVYHSFDDFGTVPEAVIRASLPKGWLIHPTEYDAEGSEHTPLILCGECTQAKGIKAVPSEEHHTYLNQSPAC